MKSLSRNYTCRPKIQIHGSLCGKLAGMDLRLAQDERGPASIASVFYMDAARKQPTAVVHASLAALTTGISRGACPDRRRCCQPTRHAPERASREPKPETRSPTDHDFEHPERSRPRRARSRSASDPTPGEAPERPALCRFDMVKILRVGQGVQRPLAGGVRRFHRRTHPRTHLKPTARR